MVKPRKRFGQNFLQNGAVIDQMVAAIRPQAGEHLIEIGPGQGALTKPLIDVLGHIDAVELDRDLIPLLNAELGETITIHESDVLKFDFSSLIKQYGKIRVAGNLPYNISTQLMFHVLQYADSVVDMHFLLQKEVVDRLAAAPSCKDYGRLSVMIQYHCEVEPLFLVQPESFYPIPKVMSQFVRLKPKANKLPLKDLSVLEKLVTQSFHMRRKTLRNNLKGLLSEDEIMALGIAPEVRAETLSLAQFVAMANFLA